MQQRPKQQLQPLIVRLQWLRCQQHQLPEQQQQQLGLRTLQPGFRKDVAAPAHPRPPSANGGATTRRAARKRRGRTSCALSRRSRASATSRAVRTRRHSRPRCHLHRRPPPSTSPPSSSPYRNRCHHPATKPLPEKNVACVTIWMSLITITKKCQNCSKKTI